MDIVATAKSAEGLVSVINDSLNIANHSENISIREGELKKARKNLTLLKSLVHSNPSIELTNLQEVENNIVGLEEETQYLAYINSDKKEQILQEIEKRRLVSEKASLLLTQSDEERFENDCKLDHVVLDVTYVSPYALGKRVGSIACKLELFGYCLELTTVDTKETVVKAIFDPLKVNNIPYYRPSCTISEKIIESWWTDYDIIPGMKLPPNAYSGENFKLELSPENYNILKNHIDIMNEFQPCLVHYLGWKQYKENAMDFQLLEREREETLVGIESITNKMHSTVYQLLGNRELVEMGRSFIDNSNIALYVDAYYLSVTEDIFDRQREYTLPDKLLLMSTKEVRDDIRRKMDYAYNFEDKIRKEIQYYLENNLSMFTRVIKENTATDSQYGFFVTYLFIYNVAIEHLAQKWDNEYKEYFHNIIELTLDEAIERYCSIDDIVHRDNISLGKFIYYLIKHDKFTNNERNYFTCWEIVIPRINHIMENKKFSNFVSRLKTSNTSNQIKYTINDVDLMDGLEFEKFIAELFSKMGYESEITKASGDQGIDVIASKNGNTIGIQAKCYSSTVGNSAIQEVVAGKVHYRLHKAIVVTNNFFTDSAQQLAKSNSIILWDRHILKKKIDENFNSSIN